MWLSQTPVDVYCLPLVVWCYQWSDKAKPAGGLLALTSNTSCSFKTTWKGGIINSHIKVVLVYHSENITFSEKITYS